MITYKDKKTKKICHITASAGGVRTFIQNVCNAVNEEEFKCIVLSPWAEEKKVRETLPNVEVFQIPMSREISPHKDITAIIRILFCLIKIQPDILHGHSTKGGIYSILCGRLLNIPVIYTPHAFSFLGQEKLRKVFAILIEKILTHFSAYLLPSSKSEKKSAIYDIGWKSRAVLSIYYNSIPITNYSKKIFNINQKTVITLARLTYQKNPILFLDVAKAVLQVRQDVTFIMVGANSGLTDELSESVDKFLIENKLKSNILIKPWTSNSEIDTLLEQTDIYLSTSRYEGLPTVVLLAYDKEIPIVATNVDGNRDVVDHKCTGLLADNKDQLVQYTINLLDNKNIRIEYGKNGKKMLLAKFNVSKNIKLLESIYKTIIL